jgi:molybdenum cofactor biosynthesis enzyme MoaA
MKISEYEVFKFGENKYTEFVNNGKKYLLNKEPYLDIVLTDFCNANCWFCIADLIHNKLNGDFDIFKQKILFAIEKMNVREVLLLGGEPTMSKMLIPKIELLKTLSLDKIVMTTNGIRLAQNKEYCRKFLSSGLTNINISFMNTDIDKQKHVTNSKYILKVSDIKEIYEVAKECSVSVRINNNVFLGNNDSLNDIIDFYNKTHAYCDSIKISPILEVDNFSVIDKKTEWAKSNRLNNKQCLNLFNNIQNYYSDKYNVSIIENDLQFGFVKNTMIPLKIPIVLNWNFGDYTGMMKKVTEENKINNLKLLSNNELSLSWNRESKEYFIHT